MIIKVQQEQTSNVWTWTHLTVLLILLTEYWWFSPNFIDLPNITWE